MKTKKYSEVIEKIGTLDKDSKAIIESDVKEELAKIEYAIRAHFRKVLIKRKENSLIVLHKKEETYA